MMDFLRVFKSQMPDIIKRLDNVKAELNITKNNIEHLMSIEEELSKRVVDNGVVQNQLIEMAARDFGVAMWVKDINGRFLFANKMCCETILKCTLDEALNLKNGDFKKDALAVVCMKTDQEIIKHKTTKRWIEFALYEDGQKVFVDTIKSPVFDDKGEFVGIVGNAVNITKSIPEIIKCQDRKSNFIEIPLKTTLSFGKFADLLERRLQPRE